MKYLLILLAAIFFIACTEDKSSVPPVPTNLNNPQGGPSSPSTPLAPEFLWTCVTADKAYKFEIDGAMNDDERFISVRTATAEKELGKWQYWLSAQDTTVCGDSPLSSQKDEVVLLDIAAPTPQKAGTTVVGQMTKAIGPNYVKGFCSDLSGAIKYNKLEVTYSSELHCTAGARNFHESYPQTGPGSVDKSFGTNGSKVIRLNSTLRGWTHKAGKLYVFGSDGGKYNTNHVMVLSEEGDVINDIQLPIPKGLAGYFSDEKYDIDADGNFYLNAEEVANDSRDYHKYKCTHWVFKWGPTGEFKWKYSDEAVSCKSDYKLAVNKAGVVIARTDTSRYECYQSCGVHFTTLIPEGLEDRKSSILLTELFAKSERVLQIDSIEPLDDGSFFVLGKQAGKNEKEAIEFTAQVTSQGDVAVQKRAVTPIGSGNKLYTIRSDKASLGYVAIRETRLEGPSRIDITVDSLKPTFFQDSFSMQLSFAKVIMNRQAQFVFLGTVEGDKIGRQVAIQKYDANGKIVAPFGVRSRARTNVPCERCSPLFVRESKGKLLVAGVNQVDYYDRNKKLTLTRFNQ